jgi:branched-chain amino acid transport system permease protein
MLQALKDGLVQGAIYAVIALGYTMVYGILNLINFAHGEVVMLGAYAGVVTLAGCVGSGLMESAGAIPCLAGALAASMGVCVVYGLALERAAYRPLRDAPQLSPLISAIGMSIVLQNFVMLARGSTPLYVPTHVAEWTTTWDAPAVSVGGVRVSTGEAVILVVCVALMLGLLAFVARTRTGKAMRATAQDKVMAGLVGIPIDRVIATTFAVGSLLAAVAGILQAAYTTQASYTMGFVAGLKAFTAAVLGGIGNIPGAMVGGLVLGLAESVGIHFFGAEYKDLYSFGVLLLVLVVRPKGIMGERVAEKV